MDINSRNGKNLNIKFALIDYFSNKNISSREKNGEKKVWQLSSVLKIFYGGQFMLKVRSYDNCLETKKGISKILFIFSDGLYYFIECSKLEYNNWIKNLDVNDIQLLRENIIDSKDNVNLNNHAELETKNKVKIGL